MKNKRLLILPLVVLTVSSCAINVHHETNDYILTLKHEKEDLRILQLTDPHLSAKDDDEAHYAIMQKTIDKAGEIDLIVVTGDLFTFASKETAKHFFNFLDSQGCPWTVTFGNHDEQCSFSIDWMTKTLNEWGNNCYFIDQQDDDVTGNCNFVINVMHGEDLFEQLFIMDSNRYYFGSSFGYDFFKQDQIDWYSRVVHDTTIQYGLTDSLMFYHIPLPEVNDAWNAAQEDPSLLKHGSKGEKCCPPDINSGFFDVIDELNSTKGMYFGHDHVNDFAVTYRDVDFVYGVKSTNRIYFDEAKLGGLVINVKKDHSLVYEQIFSTYEEATK